LEQLRPILPNFLKNINALYGTIIHSETKDLGYEFKELEFGESTVYDIYKHGPDYKKLLSERKKEIGLHLPRSTRQYKMVDYGSEITKNMELKTFEVIHNTVLIFQLYTD
jgi:hypothetical protein